MISREAHDILMELWVGRKYATPDRITKRLTHLEGLLPLLEDRSVLELGANAGLHAVEIMKHASSYVGVEPSPVYQKQWHTTCAHFCPHRIMVILDAVEDVPLPFCNDGSGALVACVMLYLLSPKELVHIEKRILPECSLVIIQERVAGRGKKGNTTNGLHTPEAITKWLTAQGFACYEYWHRKGKFFEIVGHRS